MTNKKKYWIIEYIWYYNYRWLKLWFTWFRHDSNNLKSTANHYKYKYRAGDLFRRWNNPGRYNSYDSMAEFYLNQKEYEKAKDYYQKALNTYPGANSARQKLRSINEMNSK